MAGELETLVKSALDDVARQALRGVIQSHAGYGIDNEIKDMIKEEARRLLKEDQEIKNAVREALVYWIAKQK